MSARMPGSLGGHWHWLRSGLPASTSGWSGARSCVMNRLSFRFGLVFLCTLEEDAVEPAMGR